MASRSDGKSLEVSAGFSKDPTLVIAYSNRPGLGGPAFLCALARENTWNGDKVKIFGKRKVDFTLYNCGCASSGTFRLCTALDLF